MIPRRPSVQEDFSADEFRRRREQVFGVIGAEAVAVLTGAAVTGAFDIFRQTNDFYYLCGIEVPHAYLILDGRDHSSRLYLPPLDEKMERSEGSVLTADDRELARQVTGVDVVSDYQQLFDDLQEAKTLWTPFLPGERRQMCRDTIAHAAGVRVQDPWDDWQSREERLVSRMKDQFTEGTLHDLSSVIDRLREVKSETEISLMRRAGSLTSAAVIRAMEVTQPGVFEYQLVAEAERTFADGGSRGGAYRAILACGDNIWNPHYFRNNAMLQDGQLLLMDYAPDWHYYTSDIGRMWPVNGSYDSQQRELYGFIVEYHKALLSYIRPHVTAHQIMEEAAEKMQTQVESTQWSSVVFRDAARRTLSFTGHLSHGVGMAVHDAGDYRRLPLRPGVVFALDPQMWVPEEQLYIRVEDTIAVTTDGMEVLTDSVPLELNQVEKLIGTRAKEANKVTITSDSSS